MRIVDDTKSKRIDFITQPVVLVAASLELIGEKSLALSAVEFLGDVVRRLLEISSDDACRTLENSLTEIDAIKSRLTE